MNAAVINKNAKLQRVPEACADTNWSRNTLMKVAAEANAIIRVGRTVRIDMPVLYKYIDTVYKLLKELIEQVKPALIVFDPLQAFIPVDMQMGQRNAMRACLSPLIGIGEQYGVTSLIVVHTNKKQGVFGRNRIADSADVWDIARSVMIVGSVPGSNERYLSQEKSNYGPLSQTVLFNIGEKGAEFTGFSDKHDADYVGMRDYERRQAPQRADTEWQGAPHSTTRKKTALCSETVKNSITI